MTSIWYGRLVPVGTLLFLALVATSWIWITNDPTGWAAIGIIAFIVILGAVLMVGYLITGYVRQHRNPTPFSKGLIEGTWTVIATIILLVIATNVISFLTL